jgi:hypothetical protein
MNSARFARFAVDCRPRYGFGVIKELMLLRIHLDSVLTIDEETQQGVSLYLKDNWLKENRKMPGN